MYPVGLSRDKGTGIDGVLVCIQEVLDLKLYDTRHDGRITLNWALKK